MGARIVFVSGAPTSFLGLQLLGRLVGRPDLSIRLVAREEDRPALESVAASSKAGGAELVILDGDPSAMDLGLSGEEHNRLASEVQEIHYAAAAPLFGSDRAAVERWTLATAREALELAEASEHIDKVVHWSSAFVSGARRGYVLEDELEVRSFPSAAAEGLHQAEQMFSELDAPVVTLRPSLVVGDSSTGEIDALDGPYLFLQLLRNAPPDLRIPIPGRGDLPLNMVPVDYVLDAGLRIADDPTAKGRKFHLVDPRPLSSRRVFELLAMALGRPVPRGFVPTHLAAAVLRAPGLERVAHMPREFLTHLEMEPIYDDRNTRSLLEGTGIRCPPFESYVEQLVSFVEQERPAPTAVSSTPTAE